MSVLTHPPPHKPQRLGVREIAAGRWLRLQEIEYAGCDGKVRTWEAAGRRARQGAVVVITRLLPSGQYLLVQQYRPPVDAFVLEFPAGLIDPAEDPRQTAVREVKEETGFTGSVVWFSGDALSSPGMSGESVFMAVVEVDEQAPANQHPATAWDESEHIVTFQVAPADIPAFLHERLAQGVILDSKVISYFLGLGLRW